MSVFANELFTFGTVAKGGARDHPSNALPKHERGLASCSFCQPSNALRRLLVMLTF